MYREELPRRPHVPLALYAFMVILAVVQMVLQEGVGWLDGCASRVSLVCALTLLGVYAILAVRKLAAREFVLVLAVAALCGFAVSSAYMNAGLGFVDLMRRQPVHAFEFLVQTDASRGERGDYRCRAAAMFEGRKLQDVWLTLSQRVDAGTVVAGEGSFLQNKDDEWGRNSRTQGVWGTIRLAKLRSTRRSLPLVQAFRHRALEVIEPQRSAERALLAGCLCGWREDLRASGLDEVFSKSGLSHLIAVSGSHLAIVSTLLGSLFERVGMRPRKRALLLACCGGVFVLMCGSPKSAIRAWVMTSSVMLGRQSGRRSHALSAACLAGMAMLVLDPGSAGQVGFLMSVFAVIGLCLYSPYAMYLLNVLLTPPTIPHFLPRRLRRRANKALLSVREGAAASLVAQLCTIPVTSGVFGEVSVVGPIAGAFVGVPFTAMVTTGLAGVVLAVLVPVELPILLPALLMAKVVVAIADVLSSLPFCRLSIAEDAQLVNALVSLLLLAILVAWPQINRLRVLACLCASFLLFGTLFVSWRFCAPARVCILDVGQGDAILVQEGAHAILVDAGPPNAIVQALARNHVLHLDAVVITHLHDDHYAGVEELAGHVPCGQVVVAEGVRECIPTELHEKWVDLTGKDEVELSYGDILHAGNFSLTVVWPTSSVSGNQNADSLQLLACYDDGRRSLGALLTGDAERDEIGCVLANGDVGDIDLLKVGHHGSAISVTMETAQELDPEVSVASAGENNRYGHPTDECIRILKESGSRFLCTKDVGDVDVRPSARGPVVSCASSSWRSKLDGGVI